MDVGVIGVGTMGRNHVRVYSELKSVAHLGICDVNAQAAEAIGKQHGADRLSNGRGTARPRRCSERLRTDPAPCGGRPAGLFRKEARVIEKPICATARLKRGHSWQVRPAGITIGVGHIERFNPIVAEIKKIVTKPLYVEMKRHNPASARVTGNTVVEDLMIHDIDIIVNLFFPDACHIHSVGNADLCSVLMECGGVPVALSASRKASKKIRMIYIEEEEFTVEGDFMSQEITIYRKPGQYQFETERYVQENIIEKVMVNKVEPLKVELATFIDCAKKHAPFPVTPEQAIRNLAGQRT